MRTAFNKLKNKGASSAFVLFLKKYWWTIPLGVGILLFAPKIVALVKASFAKSQVKNQNTQLTKEQGISDVQNSIANPQQIIAKSTAISKKYPHISSDKWNELNTNAKIIANALGTYAKDSIVFLGMEIPWFSNNMLWEDEQKVVKAVKKHSGTYPILAELYHDLYTKSHDLTSDLYRYLSNSDLSEIRKSHLENGNYKFI